MTAGLLGTNGLHAKASDSLEQAETAVCQTENITFPTTNGVLRTSGLFTPVQNTEEEDTSIIVEETDNEDFIVKEQNGKYENTGFVNLSSDYLYVRSSTSDDSDWTGKLYPGNVVTLEGPVGEWTAIRSGNVTGFVRSENLLEMKSAQQKIRQMEAEALKNGTEVTFSYGETKEEEASRLQAEAEQQGTGRGGEKAGTKTGCGGLRMPIYWQPLCLGRDEPHKRSGLFRIRAVGLCTLWCIPSKNILSTEKCGIRSILFGGTAGRYHLL